MSTNMTQRRVIRISDYDANPYMIAHAIAKALNGTDTWIVLHGPTMLASSVARHLHLLPSTAFAPRQKPRGVCIRDDDRDFVHWDRLAIFPKGSPLP